MKKIAVFVSGGGTNLQALLEAEKAGKIKNGKITLVISSKKDAYALTRAANFGVDTLTLSRSDYADRDAYDKALLKAVKEAEIDLIVLAGFMIVLGETFVSAYENAIINVHPALIPSFCGDGFYGLRVHEAALKKGVKVTGATVHFVSLITDGGPIIAQHAVKIEAKDTAETLQRRVMEEAEWKLLPEAVSLFCEDRLSVKDDIVYISK